MPLTGRKLDASAALSVEFHKDSHTFRTEFDRQTRGPSEAVIAAVAAAKDEDPVALPPLFETIDTDALDALFAVTSARMRPFESSLRFSYVGCEVTVNSHGTVIVNPSGRIAEDERR